MSVQYLFRHCHQIKSLADAYWTEFFSAFVFIFNIIKFDRLSRLGRGRLDINKCQHSSKPWTLAVITKEVADNYVRNIYCMLKKYSVLLGIIISISLLLAVTFYYPGGSQFDKTSIGYDWKNNYISNLFSEKAVNGSDNLSRIWAIGGMLFLSASFAIFFFEFSKKIPAKGSAKIIKYFGAIGMLFTFLIVTPLHDTMIAISSTMFLVSIFYITIFVLKSRLHLFKFLCIVCLLVFYFTLYLYGSGNFLTFLPIMQKLTFSTTIILVLGLEYFTKKEDVHHIKVSKNK
jgi:hypothetical protein